MKIKNAFFLFLTWLFGVILGVICLACRMAGLIKVLHPERFPNLRKEGNVLVVSNHPSLLEPFLLAVVLFFRWFIFSLKYAPWNAADKTNFVKNGLWTWLKERMVSVPRGNRAGESGALRRLARILSEAKQSLILFPGGGRESMGEKRGERMLLSPKGRKLRCFKHGAAWLARVTGVPVVLVWVEGTDDLMPDWHFVWPKKWRGMIRVRVGQTLRFSKDQTIEEITGILEKALLQLADQEE